MTENAWIGLAVLVGIALIPGIFFGIVGFWLGCSITSRKARKAAPPPKLPEPVKQEEPNFSCLLTMLEAISNKVDLLTAQLPPAPEETEQLNTAEERTNARRS